MQTKKKIGSGMVDPDDAPDLTKEMLDLAEVFDGDTFVRRGRGRPKVATPKEPVNLRLDHDVTKRLRANGPGWQTRVNKMLSVEYMEDLRRQIEGLKEQIKPLEDGTMKLGSQTLGEPMVDTTEIWIERMKGYIAVNEKILRDYFPDEYPS